MSDLRFPEGPAFDRNKNCWCVEQLGESLVCISDHSAKRIQVGGCPNGIAIDGDGLVWFCDSGQNSIRTCNPETGVTETILKTLDGEPLNMPNDLAFDHRGQLVFTCPGPRLDSNEGYICVYNFEHKLHKIADGLYYPNGLAFTQNGRQLLVAETGRQQIWTGDWDAESASWTNRRVFAQTGGAIGPDGMALDEDGFLYVAIYGSGCIRVFDPAGNFVNDLITPGINPTNCAFDPFQRWWLVVTEAETGTVVSIPVLKKGIMRNTEY
ncbi:SMP-30/gluconolactonase/LRE family protein [Niastella koreensis]|nr:SMP-30/gluconolactonase/LRE family protein [Niastella koreensis]